MPRLVAVSYPVDEEYVRVNREVLGGDAEVVFLAGLAEDEQRAMVGRAAAVISLRPGRELPGGALAAAPELEFLQLVSAGADHLDLAAIPERVTVASNAGAYARPMAEHVMAMALALAKRLPQRHRALAEGRWEQALPQLTLDGAVCAILGFGGIGQATARLMRGFGARIHAVNSTGQTGEPVDFAGTLADLDRLLAAADVLVIALPLTVATRGLIGARELSLMKPDAILINVARAGIVDEEALFGHVRGHPGFGAGLDVWWQEPRAGQPFRTRYPFLSLPNVIGSPHNSGSVPGALTAGARQAAANVLAHLRGEPVRGLVRRADYLLPG